jgi:hypothetical protein
MLCILPESAASPIMSHQIFIRSVLQDLAHAQMTSFVRLRYTKSVQCNFDLWTFNIRLRRSNPSLEIACPPAIAQNGSHHHDQSDIDLMDLSV